MAIGVLFRVIGLGLKGPRVNPFPLPIPVPPPPIDIPAPVNPPDDVLPVPQTDADTEAKERERVDDRPECATCPQCAAREMGFEIPHIYGSVPTASQRGYAYQHYVCPWHVHAPMASMIMEWNFKGVDFDGLHPSECHLFEAKHGYDGFLVPDDQSMGGMPKLEDWMIRGRIDPFAAMMKQATRQRDAVLPHTPEIQLTWVFSHQITYIHVTALFLEKGFFNITTECRPFI